MFQFAALLCIPMYSVCNDLKGRVSPFRHLRIKARLPAPRSLSQATTSFIACNRQGIHHVHLVTCPYNVDLWSHPQRRQGKRCVSFDACLFRYNHNPATFANLCTTRLTRIANYIDLYYFFHFVKERIQPLIAMIKPKSHAQLVACIDLRLHLATV